MEYLILTYHKRGWTGPQEYKVEGDIFDKRGDVVMRLEGRWDKEMVLIDLNSGERKTLWTKSEYHP
jgi:hypothetical protein